MKKRKALITSIITILILAIAGIVFASINSTQNNYAVEVVNDGSEVSTEDDNMKSQTKIINVNEDKDELIYETTLTNMVKATKEKELVIRQSFGTFTAPLKEDSRFFICNRGTIINMEHAVDFDGTMFLLDDGSKIVVSRELCKPARQHFMDYLFQKGGF